MNPIMHTTLCSKVVLGILLNMHTMGRWVLILLISVAIKQAVFIALIPAWQVPDEPAHVAYVQSIFEQQHFPIFSNRGMDVAPEMVASMTAIEDANPERLGRLYPPGFLSTATSGPRRLTDGSAPVRNLAARNSPLYYLYTGAAYIATYQQSLETRLLAMRAMSALLLLVTVWLVVRLAINLKLSAGTALALGAVVGWHPAMSAIFAGVNPDTALILASTWTFYLLLSPITGSTKKRALLIATAVGVATSIKPEGWFLGVPAFVWLVWQYRTITRPVWWKLFGLGGSIMAVIGGGWLLLQSWRSTTDVIVAQPTRHGTLAWNVILNNDLFERPALVFRTFWGHLGWSGVSGYTYEWVYSLILIVTALAAVGSAAWLINRKATASHRRLVWLSVTSALSLEIFYQYLYWQAGFKEGATHFPVHGRYYLPLIAPLALWLVAGIRQLLPVKRQWLANTVVAGSVMTATMALIVRAWALYRFERLAGW